MLDRHYDQMLPEYIREVRDWMVRNRYEMSDHAVFLAAKILLHRDKAVSFPPGDFIQALLNNDLGGTMRHMGSEARAHFFTLYKAWYNIDTFHIVHKYRAIDAQEPTLAHV